MISHLLHLSVFGVFWLSLGDSSPRERKYRQIGTVDHDQNNFKCFSEGFHVDARDCRVFYRCVDVNTNDFTRDYLEPQFIAYKFECGEDTVFDPDFNVCNYPRETRRIECGGTGIQGPNSFFNNENTYYPFISYQRGKIPTTSPYNCEEQGFHAVEGDCKKFVRCVDNGNGGYIKHEFTCGPGTVWDQLNTMCNYPSLVRGCEGYDTSGEQTHETGDNTEQTIYPKDPNYVGQEGHPEYFGETGDGEYPAQGHRPSQGSYPQQGQGHGQGPYPALEQRPVPGGYPAQGQEPGQGGYPTQQQRPEQGSYPTQGQRPGQGGYPTLGQRPGQGGYPTQGQRPGQGGYPTQGQRPEQGSYPTQGQRPEQGSYPTQGQAPGQGGYPTQGQRPGQGGYPTQGQRPEQGSYPTQGQAPGQGGYPTQGQRPQQGSYPTQGQRPGQGGYPTQGQAPGQGGYPTQGQAPGQGGYPTQGQRPGQGGYPTQGQAPGQGGYPTQGQRPGQGGYPTQGQRPGQGGYPTQGQRPEQGSYPTQGQAPGQGGYPTQGQRPGQGGYPTQGQRPGQGGYQTQGQIPGQGGYPAQEQRPQQGSYPTQGQEPGQGGYPTQEQRPGQGGYPHEGGQQENYPGSPDHGYKPGKIPGEGILPDEDEGGVFTGKCQGPGFYGVPGNCKKFVRCVRNEKNGFSKFEFECGPGTGWDMQLQTCNFISQIEGCENEITSSENEFPNSKPSQEFKPGQNGRPGSGFKPCPEGKPTQEGTQTLVPGQGGYPGQNERPKEPNQSGPDYYPEGSSPSNSHGDPSVCQNEGFYGVEENCKKFYRCIMNDEKNYNRYDFECGEGTIWDSDNLACNYPSVVQRSDCKNLEIQPSTIAYPTTSQTPTQPTNTSMAMTTKPTRPSSSRPMTTKPTRPSSSRPMTTKPTRPSSSIPMISTTPKPMTSSPMNLTTSRPISSSSSTMTLSPGQMSSTMKPTDRPMPPAGSVPCENQMAGPVKCDKAGFYPDPKDCRKFYRCVDWDENKGMRLSVYFFECANGTIWDPMLETCNHEKSVYPPRNCNTDMATDSISELSTTPIFSTATDMIITSMTMTEMTTGVATDQTTDQTTSQTEGTEGTTTVTEPTTTNGEQTTELTTEPGAESSTAFSTPDTKETTFSEFTTSTDFSSEPTTEETSVKPTEEPDQEEPTTESNQTTEPSEVSTPNGSPTTPEAETTNPNCPKLEEGQSAYVCPTGFRRHPKNCNFFYQCTVSEDTGDVNIMVLGCKNDTVYDEKQIQCLPPDDKSCKMPDLRKKTRGRSYEDESSLVFVSRKKLCPSEGSFPYEGDCLRFFKCKKGSNGKIQGYLYQCPEKYFFSDLTNRCEESTKSTKCTRGMPETRKKNLKWKSKVPTELYLTNV